jgi:hypothetical protein
MKNKGKTKKTTCWCMYVVITMAMLSLSGVAGAQQGKILTTDSIISLSQAGLSDANVILVIKKSRGNFDLGAGEVERLAKAGVDSAVLDAIKLKSEADIGTGMPSEKVAGFDVSLSYLSVPMAWTYLEQTRQDTIRWGYSDTIDMTLRQKKESFRQSELGVRFAKMSDISKSVSVGIECGILPSISAKRFSFSAPQVVPGSTITYITPDSPNIFSSTMGVTTGAAEFNSVVVPVLIKAGYKITSAAKGFFKVTAAAGAYALIAKAEYRANSPEPNNGGEYSYKNKYDFGKIVPAAEIGLDGSWSVSNSLRLTVGADMGLTSKTEVFKQTNLWFDNSYPSGDYTNGYPYKDIIEMGGLSYGGRIGLSFLF